jgi:tripartite-type tricarboxylate transporter receptor subunit TctC
MSAIAIFAASVTYKGDIMKLPRRKFMHLAAGAAALPVSRFAWAQTYPTRPVRVVVAAAAGGANDTLARLMGQWLSERLGQSFVIENRPGAGTNIGTEAVVHAPADGYTLLLVSPPSAINATLYDKLNFNFLRDIAPVAAISRESSVMVVNPSVPAKTVPEFIAHAKANPGKVNMASAGTGTTPHVAGELFKIMAGINMVHVPYRGGGPAITDLLGGQVQVFFGNMASSIEYIRIGKLRALAVTNATRSEALPDTPTVGDFVPGYEASGWNGFGAPRNTPADIVGKLNREINAGLADPKIKARLADLGASALPGSPADFGKHIAEETEKGDWTFNLRVNLDGSFTFPPGFFHSYRAHFDDAGPGSHGGRKFKGKFVNPATPGLELTGETVYAKRGVQLVQMLGVIEATQYLWVLCGKHVPVLTDPKKILIWGAAFDVGQSEFSGPGGQGTQNSFEMIKLTK